MIGFLFSSLVLVALFLCTALGAGSQAYHAYYGTHFIHSILAYIPVPFT